MKIKNVPKLFYRLFALLVLCFVVTTNVYAQKLNLNFKDTPISTILKEITKQTGYTFVYSNALKEVSGKIDLSYSTNHAPISKVLEAIFSKKEISYKIDGTQIILAPKGVAPTLAADKETVVISGMIMDDLGDPLPGVTVKNKATGKFVASEITGKYSIEAKEGDVLSFASIGMAEYESAVGKGAILNVSLKPDAIALQDVVVTGYQTISKERATGSFVKVSAEALKMKPVVNISSALNGLTPGMSITTNSDGQSRFLIRGQGTMQGRADMDPLIVVDGFAIQGFLNETGYNSERDPFSSINPNDVESITVLKDAAATSIYGARAANGVIVITTKKGKKDDKLNISVGGFVSISSKPDLDYAFNMAGTAQTVKYLENIEKYAVAYNESARDPYYTSTNPFVYLPKASELLHEYKRAKNITKEQYDTGIAQLMLQDGTWEDEYNKYIFKNSVNQQYNVSINGGSKRNRYNFSIVYDNENGTSKGNSKEKIVLNLANTYEIVKDLHFSVGVNAQISSNKNDGISFYDLKNFTTPYLSLFNQDGSYSNIPASMTNEVTMYEPILKSRFGDVLPAEYYYNPLQDRSEKSNSTKFFNARFQASLDYKIIEGLNISVKGQYERNQYKNRMEYKPNSFFVRNYNNMFSQWSDVTKKYETVFPQGGIFTDSGDLYSSYNLRGQIDYNKKFKEKHDLVVLLGGEIISSTRELTPSYTRYGYNEYTNSVQINPDFFTKVKNLLGQTVNYPYASLGKLQTVEDRFLSVYMNLSYTYDRRYTVTMSARTDASNFISDNLRNKFSPFWSIGAAWNLRNESFIKDATWLDILKLRGSYGIAGVAAGKSLVSTITTIRTGTPSVIYSNNEPYNTINIRGNPTLSWEKSRTLDIAVDFSMFQGKLYGTFDFYNKYSYDVLSSATTSYILQSQASAISNNAEISNKGIEVLLGSEQKIADGISWRGDFNISYNSNKVEKYNVVPTFFGGPYVPQRPLGSVYAYYLVGYSSDGYPVMESKDGTLHEVKSRADTHLYDKVNTNKGENGDSNNWYRYRGTTIAPYNLGFTNTFRIYDFTLSFMITGKFGHVFGRTDAPTNDQRTAGFAKSIEGAMNNDYSGSYYHLPIYNENNKEVFNMGNAYTYIATMHNFSATMFEDAGYIKLNEVYLGYDISRLFGKGKSFVRGFNIYAQARNLGMIWTANGKGIDPDFIWGNIKPATLWTFGLKLNF
ncbi:MAG: SusC/RagA family TonB-linked outer membrane protein [Bacteroidales bacterium]